MIHNPLKSSRGGFSLVELMIAMVIAIVSLGAIYSVFASVQKTSTSNEVTARVMQSLRTSVDFMESDIRMAGLDRFGSAAAGIEVATATNLRFTADRNMNGTIDTTDLSDGLQEQDLERVTYIYDAANQRLRQCLSEGAANAWDTVAENVENFSFIYFDANNNQIPFPISDNLLIRFIEVSISVRNPAGRADDVSRTITKRIFCRNLTMN
jgi:prepilin-type N-terminal cleavage/methylation domain-containing protein